jgi:hypothetical protein
VVEPTGDLYRLQDELIAAVETYTVKTGTPAAFFSDEGGRDIQNELIDYVADFVADAAGKRSNPHVTNWRRNGSVFERDVGGAVRVTHVLAGWRVSLSAWQLWHGSKGTWGVDADTLNQRSDRQSSRENMGGYLIHSDNAVEPWALPVDRYQVTVAVRREAPTSAS